MTRITERLTDLRRRGKRAFVGFVTAGDPSIGRTEEVALEMDRAGVDILELGVPFSDPLADGPVIQRSSERALRGGTTLAGILELVRRIRRRSEIPLVLFSYMNPLFRYGIDRAVGEARDSGADGVLVTDLPPEEADPWLLAARGVGLDTIFLAAPTSPDARLRSVASLSTGFVYAVSRTGVTGEQGTLSSDAGALVGRIKRVTEIPVAVGFGISTPEQVASAAALADAVVVGSALVRFMEEDPTGDVGGQVRWLKSAI